jgi:cytochrome c5
MKFFSNKALVLVVIVVVTVLSAQSSEKGGVTTGLKSTTEPKAITEPKSTTTGFMQEITEQRVHKGRQRSGKEVYEYRCKGCHGKNTQGAPMPDDTFEWSNRVKKGMEVLYQHSMEGYKNYLMPPKGGCRDCSEQEVYAAVRYMITASGLKLPVEGK